MNTSKNNLHSPGTGAQTDVTPEERAYRRGVIEALDLADSPTERTV